MPDFIESSFNSIAKVEYHQPIAQILIVITQKHIRSVSPCSFSIVQVICDQDWLQYPPGRYLLTLLPLATVYIPFSGY